jgi:hypothetical protein
MTWRHVVIEIYEPDNGWPTIGTPADWIEKDQIGWCQGDAENLVALTSVWKIAWWKIRYWTKDIYDSLSYYFYWKWWMKLHHKDYLKWYGDTE